MMPRRIAGFGSGFGNGFGNHKAKAYIQIVTPAAVAANYDDGDILSAVPWRAVRQERAESVCFAKTLIDGKRQVARLNANMLYDAGDVAEDYLAEASRFKFERINATQGRITRLSDMDEIVFTTKQPFTQHDGKTVQMDLDRFITRRRATLASPGGRGKPIFGTPGNEYWYGSTKPIEHDNLDTIWTAVEAKTPFTEDSLCNQAFFSDYRKRLAISVNDMTDEEATALTQPKVETEAVTVDSVTPTGDEWTVTLSATPPAIASIHSAFLHPVGDPDRETNNPIGEVNGNNLLVGGPSAPATGPMEITCQTGKRQNRIEWRNLRDVVESDVVDRSVEVRIDTIRKHVRQEIAEVKT